MKLNPIHPLARFLAVLIVGATMATAAQAQSKVALIDLKKVFDGYYRTKQADAQLKERAAGFEKARAGLVEDFEKARGELTQLSEALEDKAISAEERERRRESADKKAVEVRQIQEDIRQFDTTSRATLGEQQRRMRDRILDEIREIINVKAKDIGASLVVDSAGQSVNQTPIVLYTDGQNDLTSTVLDELNSRGPVELPSPSAE